MFKARGQVLGCSKCPQCRIWEHASDWLNSFVTEQKKQKRGWTLDQLGFASNGFTHRRSLCTSACETYMMQFLLNFSGQS